MRYILHFTLSGYYAPILLGLSVFGLQCGKPLYDPPRTPAETVQSFSVPEGFTVELVASEPLTADPVEMIFDHRGRIFVVEMPDYPFKPEPGKGLGRIKQLLDDNQDGQMDRAITFVENISEATSIHPWKEGFLVCAAPHILYLRDTDNDGKADSTEILFSGFFENNSEAQITNLQFMPDNWIYASNHGQGGEILFHRNKESNPLQIAGGDFRFRLDLGAYERVSGTAQFGQTFNDRIHRFITQNTLHIRHVVIPHPYLYRHDFLPDRNVSLNISDHDLEMFQETPPPYWRAERTRRRQLAYDEQKSGKVEYAEDHFTGASGGTFFGSPAFGEAYYGNIFTGDVAGNLIHRDILVPLENSPTYVAQRAAEEKNREFLSTTDSWFRPSSVTVGPDGFLYVIDMYRQHIETPLSIPEDLKEDMDFLAGSDRGRIYRIRPKDQPAKTSFEDLTLLSGKQWCLLLEHQNRWQRLQAHRLILESEQSELIDPLLQLFQTSPSELARLHAFYLLEAKNQLTGDILNKALNDQSPVLREQALVVAEKNPEAVALIMPLIKDADTRVRFQACLSLGNFEGTTVTKGLLDILSSHYQDPWFRMAVLSAPAGSSWAFLEQLKIKGFFENLDDSKVTFLSQASRIIAHRGEIAELSALQELLLSENILGFGLSDQIFNAFSEGLKKSKNTIVLSPALQIRLDSLSQEKVQ